MLEKTEAPSYADGWRSVDEIAQELGMKTSSVANRIVAWRKADLVEVWSGTISSKDGTRLVRACRYRVKAG